MQSRNEKIVEMRWDGMTLGDIGREYGITRERVRQIVTQLNGPTAFEAKAARTKPCRVPECEACTGHRSGLCEFHRRRQQNGKPLNDPKYFRRWKSASWCTHPGCDLPAHSANLCKAHGRISRNGGDMNADIQDQSARRKSMFCQVTGCDGGHYSRGYCRKHYNRIITNRR